MGKPSENTKQITVRLPKSIYESLDEWAEEEFRAIANLAAHLLEQDVRAKFPDRFPPKIIKPKKTPLE